MGKTTGISWAHSTFGPWRSCVEESPACDHCYAREMAKRNPLLLGKWGSEENGGTRVVAATNYWKEPGKWNKAAAAEGVRKRVFCASMADFFEKWSGLMMDHKGQALLKPYLDSESQPENWISEPLGIDGKLTTDLQGWRPVTMDDVRKRTFDYVIDVTPDLIYLLLTKRPQNIIRMTYGARTKLDSALKAEAGTPEANIWHRDNCWLGTTVETQEYADKRIPELLKARSLSPVLWLSCEPLLGPINLFDFSEGVLRGPAVIKSGGMTVGTADYPSEGYDDSQPGIDWVICGCESGSKARPTELDWIRSLRDQCQAAGVAFFVKQLVVNGKLRKQLEDFPSDLQIQQVPKCD